MEKTVREVSRMTGISVRALHYYDEIGLLKPDSVTKSGYRLYGENAMERLQQILFFRELDFPLKEIREILDSPSFDKTEALRRHRQLLQWKRGRLDRLIRLVDRTLKGENTMSFQEFDTDELDALRKRYADEARETWGGSAAWRQSEEKARGRKKEDWAFLQREAEGILDRLADAMDRPPEDPEVRRLVREWQDHLTRHYYDCTDEILAGLGELYRSDARFPENLDRRAPGLALFLSRAIASLCEKKR